MYFKIFSVILCFIFMLSGITSPLVSSANNERTFTLAVLDLEPNGVSRVESRGLSDKLRSHIFRLIQNNEKLIESYTLIERTQMDNIFDQFEVQNTGCVSDSCAVEFGKMLQADRIVIGTVSLIGQTYSVIARMVDVESSKTLYSADLQHRGAIDDVLISIIPQVGDELLTEISTISLNSVTQQEVVKSTEILNDSIISKPNSDYLIEKYKDNETVSLAIKELINGEYFYFVLIPEGSFKMGLKGWNFLPERPEHNVTLNSFYMSMTEITQNQCIAITGDNPSYFTGYYNHPVEQVNWYDATIFCNMLSDKVGLDRCYDEETWDCDFSKNGYRLPTEAEWEYACKSGTKTKYYNGNNDGDLSLAGWYSGNSDLKTHPVNEKKANNWGLYDMHGNVEEWCNDWYGSYDSDNLNNPIGKKEGMARVLRGGNVNKYASNCSSTNRNYNRPLVKSSGIGFRIVRRATTD